MESVSVQNRYYDSRQGRQNDLLHRPLSYGNQPESVYGRRWTLPGYGSASTSGDTMNPMYTVFSLWDTFRALHPLMTIIDPDLNNQFINSLIKKHQEGGIYPMWDWAPTIPVQ